MESAAWDLEPTWADFVENGRFGHGLEGWNASGPVTSDGVGARFEPDGSLSQRVVIPEYAVGNELALEMGTQTLGDEQARIELDLYECPEDRCSKFKSWQFTGPSDSLHRMRGVAGSSILRIEIRVLRGSVRIDDVALLVEGTTQVTDQCEPIPLSATGQAILDAIEQHAATRSSQAVVSELSRCNQRAGSVLVTQEAFEEKVHEMIRNTRRHTRIATYKLTQEPIIGLAPALRDLHDAWPGDQGPYPVVELLYSVMPIETPSPVGVIQLLEQEIGVPSSDWHFYLITHEYGHFGSADFSHSKQVIRDDQEALIGGHNLVEFVSYPVDDASLVLRGDAAVSAARHYDALVRTAQTLIDFGLGDLGYRCGGSDNFGPAHACNTGESAFLHRDILNSTQVPRSPPLWSLPPARNVFSLGRGRMSLEDGGDIEGDYSADHAIMAALGSAQASITLVQHGMTNHVLPTQNKLNPMVARSLLRALFERDVLVTMIISDNWPGSPVSSASARHTLKLMDEALPSFLADFPELGLTLAEARDILDCRLQVYRYGYPGNLVPYTHAKIIVIDSQGYYVGAQNLYPNVDILNELDDESGIQLANHGLYFDDPRDTARLLDEYLIPVLESSRRVDLGDLRICPIQ